MYCLVKDMQIKKNDTEYIPCHFKMRLKRVHGGRGFLPIL